MFALKNISYQEAGLLSPLVLNYLKQEKQLQAFYTHFADVNGFSDFLKQQPYEQLDRKHLSEIVLNQTNSVNNTSEFSKNNILKLKNNRAFTVTTGHQLCLFTGPLYFIYKIISTINLAEHLKTKFSDCDFVPVYWMASEDHDFEEVSSFNAFGKTVKWQSSQTGAVGDFETEELKTILPLVSELLGTSEHAKALISLFENAYLKHKTLAEATRYLVNELFGIYGLVIVDGNDKAFKTQFKEQFKNDIFNNAPYTFVNDSIQQLKQLGYEAQVNPRPINCFYIEKGLRHRIEKKDERFILVGTEKAFTKDELENMINTTPEKISPNVVLRPMYQQSILPNLAYVGGPGELAYWLEFKKMFDELRIEFPILVARDFVTIIDKGTKNKIEKLSFEPKNFFASELELIKQFQIKSDAVFSVEQEKDFASNLYATLSEKITAIDKTLTGSVSAELQKTLNGLEMIAGKANKALKQKSETEINQIKTVKQKLFPDNVPQERFENFSSFFLKYGSYFISELKTKLNPFVLEQKVLVEE